MTQNTHTAQEVELFAKILALALNYDPQVVISALMNALSMTCIDCVDPIGLADHLADVLPEMVKQRAGPAANRAH
jgi:hypothetical protein